MICNSISSYDQHSPAASISQGVFVSATWGRLSSRGDIKVVIAIWSGLRSGQLGLFPNKLLHLCSCALHT
jgi:hypothetical protein